MRLVLAFILSCAIWGIAAAQEMPLAANCPGGQCPIGAAPYAPPGPQPYSPAELQVDARPIARIVNTQGSGRTLGTGTLVDVFGSQGLVLTCGHLFRDGAGSLVASFPSGKSYAAKLVKIDAAADLAALLIAAPDMEAVELADDFPQRGDPLVSCGYGSDGRLSCNSGRVLGYVTTLGSHGRETLELSGAARLGDSGGPVLDRNGRLVAVLFGTNGRVVDGTFCGRVRRFLQGLSPRFRGPQPESPQAPPNPRPAPLEPTDPLVLAPPSPAPPIASPPPKTEPRPQPPQVEPPPGLDPIDGAADALSKAAQPWLAAKLTAILVSFGVPGGIAGVAGGAIVWLIMRRTKNKLQAELDRLKIRLGEQPAESPSGEGTSALVERHHNRYVPYEISLLDKAWSAAHARVGERYPGAVPYLKIVEGVKDQLLSGHDETPLT
jgi:Trypsin-like peptidase domain